MSQYPQSVVVAELFYSKIQSASTSSNLPTTSNFLPIHVNTARNTKWSLLLAALYFFLAADGMQSPCTTSAAYDHEAVKVYHEANDCKANGIILQLSHHQPHFPSHFRRLPSNRHITKQISARALSQISISRPWLASPLGTPTSCTVPVLPLNPALRSPSRSLVLSPRTLPPSSN